MSIEQQSKGVERTWSTVNPPRSRAGSMRSHLESLQGFPVYCTGAHPTSEPFLSSMVRRLTAVATERGRQQGLPATGANGRAVIPQKPYPGRP